MPFFLRPGSVLYSSLIYVSTGSLGPFMGIMCSQQARTHANYQLLSLKNVSQAIAISHCIQNEHFGGTLQLSTIEESIEFEESQMDIGTPPDQISSEDVHFHKNGRLFHNLNGSTHDEEKMASRHMKKGVIKDGIEIQRRIKIGLANKGKTPWNKGRKHTAETRELIKKRTIEALRNPKVRKKMSEFPHFHSDQSKARIGLALRRIWAARLKRKRLQEKCYLMWAGSIAEAAKKGGQDQQELDWDSHENIKVDTLLQYLQQKADRAREKEIAKRRAERAAKAKADKMARLAQERKEKEQKTGTTKTEKKGPITSEDKKKKDLTISKELKLRARLTKIHQKKQLDDLLPIREMAVGIQPIIQKLDLELIKRERVSFADQILAAKNKKAESPAKDGLTTSYLTNDGLATSSSGSFSQENGFV